LEIFPTQYSLLAGSALKDAIEKAYGFKDLTCRLLIHNVSDTYLLENPEVKYVFKIYRNAHRKLEEIKAEVELLSHFHLQGAPVSYPIIDLQGNFIQSFNAAEGSRQGVLFSFAQGEVKQNMSDSQLRVLGTQLALLHNLASTVALGHSRQEYTIDTLLLDPLATIKPAFAGLEAEYQYLEKAVSVVADKITTLNLASFSYGYCHYDLLPKNFHFTADDKLTFFDFDFAGKGYFVNDLGSVYAHFFLHRFSRKMTEEESERAFAVIIAAYRQVRTLTDEELKAVPCFGFAWWIFYFKFHHENFEDWSNFFYGPRFIKERVGLIKQWMDWYIAEV
jgi:Ser/Thr protein kinase RdoA (MazF antagonist)